MARELVDPQLSTVVRASGDGLVIDVSATSLARYVELTLFGADAVFSDNYFDIPAGRTRTVSTALSAGWSVQQAQDALKVRSLRDSYV
jgi:beta-mannosidase